MSTVKVECKRCGKTVWKGEGRSYIPTPFKNVNNVDGTALEIVEDEGGSE